MPKDYVGKRGNKILTPGDPGFSDPNLPWGGIRNVTGWEKPEAVKIYISGFYLIDRRTNPSVAIFKNMSIVGNQLPPPDEEPLPFASLDEVLHHKKGMHLPFADEKKVKPVALAPDPGLGNAKPNIIWVDQRTAKGM